MRPTYWILGLATLSIVIGLFIFMVQMISPILSAMSQLVVAMIGLMFDAALAMGFVTLARRVRPSAKRSRGVT